MKTRLIPLILLPLLLSCQHMPVGEPKTRQEQEDDIREAAFRYQFEHLPLPQKQRANAYYLSFFDKHGDKDPDTTFLRRFALNALPVRKASQCTTLGIENYRVNGSIAIDDSGPSYVDKATGKPGMLFKVGNLEWASDELVSLLVEYWERMGSSSFHLLHLEKINSRWVVIRDKEDFHRFLLIPLDSRQQPVRAQTKKRILQEDDIREAIFRYQFKNPGGLQGKCAGAYYLAIYDSAKRRKDPDERLMQRFVGNVPPVKTVSQCTTAYALFTTCKGDTFRTHGIVDRRTGKTGQRFTVGEIDWLSDDLLIVEGGVYEYQMGSQWCVYYVMKEGNRWVVKGERLIWIS